MRNCGLGWVESQEDLGCKGTHVESAGDSKKWGFKESGGGGEVVFTLHANETR